MLFWIFLIGIPLLLVLIGVGHYLKFGRKSYYYDPGDTVLAVFISGVVTVMLAFGTLSILIHAGWNTMQYDTKDTTTQLKNLADNSAQQGEYVGGLFASYGYVDGVRKVNYVDEHDGYATLGSVDADNARIHEGATDPRLVRHDYTFYDHALVPWNLGHGTDYDFYVPAGTISSGFTIGNGGQN